MASFAIQEALGKKQLAALAGLSKEELNSEEFLEAYTEIQQLAWTRACEGEIEETLALRNLLLAEGRDLFQHESVKQCVLHEAVLTASGQVLRQMLAYTDINARNSAGQTPLMVLLSHAAADQLEKAQLFISAPLACDFRLQTTCHYVLRSSLSAVLDT